MYIFDSYVDKTTLACDQTDNLNNQDMTWPLNDLDFQVIKFGLYFLNFGDLFLETIHTWTKQQMLSDRPNQFFKI
jgi:hypothetical protein